MLRKHFIMSGDGKPDFTITYHAPKHVPFFGGYAKDWVYGYPSYENDSIAFDENPIKFKVIGDKWNNGVGEWKFRLEDSSNRIYNSNMMGIKIDDLDNPPSNIGLGYADMYLYVIIDENNNITPEELVDNSNIITSVIFGEGIETINGSVLNDSGEGQSSCTTITLPESVTLLTGNLFDEYTSLKTITVPLNVIRIDNLCNIDGDSLEEVTLKPLTPPDASNTSKQAPLGVHSNNVGGSKKIRVYADCIDTYKNDLIWGLYSDLYDTINNTIVYYNGDDRKLYTENLDITSINYGTLPRTITNVYLPNSVTSIGLSAFYNTGLTSVVIPNSVTSIGNSAFSDCPVLTSIIIGNSITSIGDYVFSDCPVLTSVIVDENNPKYDSREDCNAIIETETNTLILGCNNTIIPNSVTSIGGYAFNGCSGLTSITIPNSVTSIYSSTFEGCSGLTSIIVDENNPKYDSRDNCNAIIETETNTLIYGCKNTIIPNSVTIINLSAFEGSGLTSITIPDSITNILIMAFSGCSELTSIIVDESNPIYDSRDNCNAIIETESNTLISGCKNTIIPDSVTSIGYDAFYNCYGLTSIIIPNSVTYIDSGAFEGSDLTSITIPNSVTYIGSGAFSNCLGLTSVVWNAVNCSNFSSYNPPFYIYNEEDGEEIQIITSFEFGDSVEHIPAYICLNMSNLTSITIPNSVTSIGKYAFSNCSGLTSVEIGNSVTSIGDYVFNGCTGLTSITIPNSVTSIGVAAFLKCGITSITIPNSVASIENGAFYYCSVLTSVEIGNSVTSIGAAAFGYCTGLTSITIPNSVTSIGMAAFGYCTGLTSVTISSIVPPTLGSNVFQYTSSNLIIYVPDESVDAYKSATNWSSYSSKIKPLSEKPV